MSIAASSIKYVKKFITAILNTSHIAPFTNISV